MRLRSTLSAELRIHPQDVRAYVPGEHGDGQFAAFTSASAGGAPLALDAAVLAAIEVDARTAGHSIVRDKGDTSSGNSLAIAEIVETVAGDTHQVMPLIVLSDGFAGFSGVCLSVPMVLDRGGVIQQLAVPLSTTEAAASRRSAERLEQLLTNL